MDLHYIISLLKLSTPYHNYILISFFSIGAFIPHRKLCICCKLLPFMALIRRDRAPFSAVTPSNVKSTFYLLNISATYVQFIEVKLRKLFKNVICFGYQMMSNSRLNTLRENIYNVC